MTGDLAHPRASCTTPLDRVSTRDNGLEATKTIMVDEPYLSGHYPGNAVYPGVFLLDLCEKLASACPAVERPFDGIDSLRFLCPVLPGDQVRMDLTLRRDGQGRVVGAAVVGTKEEPGSAGTRAFTVRMAYR